MTSYYKRRHTTHDVILQMFGVLIVRFIVQTSALNIKSLGGLILIILLLLVCHTKRGGGPGGEEDIGGMVERGEVRGVMEGGVVGGVMEGRVVGWVSTDHIYDIYFNSLINNFNI